MGAATSDMSDSAKRERLNTQSPASSLMSKISLPLTLRGIQSGLPNDCFPPPSHTPLDDPKSDDSPTLYDGFDLEGIDQDDLIQWSQAAPEGQRLEDAKSHEKRESPKGSSSMSSPRARAA